jgi:hypothetical protein
MLLLAHFSSEGTQEGRGCAYRDFNGIRPSFHTYLHFQLYKNLIHMGELGRTAYWQVYQLPRVCVISRWNQYRNRHRCYIGPDTITFTTLDGSEEEDTDCPDVRCRRLVSHPYLPPFTALTRAEQYYCHLYNSPSIFSPILLLDKSSLR